MDSDFDQTQWPRYMFHPEQEPARVETPEEEEELLDLEEEWRREPYSDLEKFERREAQKHTRGQRVQQVLTEPIEIPSRQSAAQRKIERDKLSYQRRQRKKRAKL